MLLPMKITEQVRRYGKVAGVGVVGLGLGAAGGSVLFDSGDEVQNLQDQVDELEDENEDLNDQVDNLQDRPTQESYNELRDEVAQRFTQEQVNEMLAREDVLEYLPVIADEEVEVTYLESEYVDGETGTDTLEIYDGSFQTVSADYNGEEFDEVRASYEHEDEHFYYADAVEFEDSEDADEYEEEARDMVDDQDYEDQVGEDAAVIRDGDTVVYVYGNAETSDFSTYDFDAFTGQY